MPEGQLEEGYLLGGRYRILRVIGQGGMGTVYQAEHERLNAILAIKEIRGPAATGTAQQATMEQYEQEARFLVRLTHPNLPKVTDAFVDDSRFYLVMDFVEGVTLESRLRERGGKPLDPAMVVDWAIEIADVLGYLHSQDPPIIFRDLKPSNVMVQPDGHIKLIDFGIARRFQPGASHDTALLGSVGYSPPEQFGKRQTDTRSDIYALGATMHHLLTAQDPSSTPFKFGPVDQISLGAPLALTRLTAQCLAMEPELRPPDIGTVITELRTIRDGLHHVGAPGSRSDGLAPGSLAAPGGISGVRPRSAALSGSASTQSNQDRRMRLAVLGVATLLILGGGAFGIMSAHSRSHGDKPSPAPQPPPTPPTTGGSAGPTSAPGTAAPTPTTTGTDAAVDNTAKDHDPSGQLADPAVPQPGSGNARCSVEVVGPSPDGKSLRLHITGEINGKKDAAGMAAAYFYNPDKTQLMAKDPKGAYATTSGQLYAQFSFSIDADSKPIDVLIDVPTDQFTNTNNLLFRCIVYADSQIAGQTALKPLALDSPGSSGP